MAEITLRILRDGMSALLLEADDTDPEIDLVSNNLYLALGYSRSGDTLTIDTGSGIEYKFTRE